MMRFGRIAALVGLGSVAYAQVDQQCPGRGLCYSLNIPEETASSGDGEIYFQITASTQFSWVAFGQGDSMSGSQIFVLYTDPSSSNVTISPRLGEGHRMPEYNSDAQVTLLEGSGIADGQMTANVRCDSCTQWGSGESMDFTSNSADFIYAFLPGDPIDGDESAQIRQHADHGDLSFDFATAKGGQSLNPFVTENGDNTVPTSQDDNGGSDSSDLLGAPNAFQRNPQRFVNAHALTASLAIVVILPLGAIVVRLLSIRHLAMLHATIQLVGTALFIAAFGLGVYVARNLDLVGEYHPIIGIIIFVLLMIQPIGGLIHHRLYKQHGRRTITSHAHIWFGRIIITLGIINGGLGFKLAGEESNGKRIAYGVIAGIIWLLYVAAAIFGESKRRRSAVGGPQMKI